MKTAASIVIFLIIVASNGCQYSVALEQFLVPTGCSSDDSVCANSTADRSFSVRFKAQCTHECQHGGGGGRNSACVGVNYRQDVNVCEIYNQCPVSYNANETGCQYLQREITAGLKNCTVRLNCGTTSGNVPTLAYVVTGANAVMCLTSYNDQLFVSRSATGLITVYNTANFQRTRDITIFGVLDQFDSMAISYADNFLYLTNYDQKKVYKVALPLNTTTDNIAPTTSWSVSDAPVGVSVNGAKNILVAMYGCVEEYTSSGTLVRQIVHSYFHFQAVEQLNGALAVSIYNSPNDDVYLISTSGVDLRNFGSTAQGSGPGKLSLPYGLAVDNQGFILVCDYNNDRVVILNPTLSEARVLLANATGLISSPRSIWLDQAKGRLYVGELRSPYRTLVFGNMFSIRDAFTSMELA